MRDLVGNLVGVGFLYAVAAPFALPHAALDDDFGKVLLFPTYPYAVACPGYLTLDPAGSPELAEKMGKDQAPKIWGVQLSLENGNDFAGLNRAGGHLLFDTSSRLGILTNWNYYHENLGNGRTDYMVVGDVNATFRFAQSEWAVLRAGLGLRLRRDHGAGDVGFNFHYGGDFFPVNPVVVSTSLDLGNLGSAGVVHLRGTVGVTHHGWELFGGYDWLRIGDVNLQGPLLGLRVWF